MTELIYCQNITENYNVHEKAMVVQSEDGFSTTELYR